MFLVKKFDMEYVLALLQELLPKEPFYFGPRIAVIEEVMGFERLYGHILPENSFYKGLAIDICRMFAPEAELDNAE